MALFSVDLDTMDYLLRREQVCRCAGERTSELVDACMHDRTRSGSGGGGMSLGSTLFLLLVVAGFFAAAGYVHYKRTQAQMRDQVSAFVG